MIFKKIFPILLRFLLTRKEIFENYVLKKRVLFKSCFEEMSSSAFQYFQYRLLGGRFLQFQYRLLKRRFLLQFFSISSFKKTISSSSFQFFSLPIFSISSYKKTIFSVSVFQFFSLKRAISSFEKMIYSVYFFSFDFFSLFFLYFNIVFKKNDFFYYFLH